MRNLIRRLLKRRKKTYQQPSAITPFTAQHNDYVLADKGLAELSHTDLHPDWLAFCADPNVALHEPSAGFYTGVVFHEHWLQRIRNEIARFETWEAANQLAPDMANSMHNSAILASQLGIEQAISQLVVEWVNPIRQKLFPDLQPFVGQHSYVVRYGGGFDNQLGFHVDASDLTLNVCLQEAVDGAEIYFRGVRCALHIDEPAALHEEWEWKHKQGVALFHHGKNRHGVRPINGGRRINLIIWCQSDDGHKNWNENWEQGVCPSWCGFEDSATTANIVASK